MRGIFQSRRGLRSAGSGSTWLMRDLGEEVGITERAVGRIVADLVESGFIARQRMGRRNHYKIDRTTTMRHVAKPNQIRPLLDLLQRDQPDPPERPTR
jgi:DNA-binding transcriptional regulator PaaX